MASLFRPFLLGVRRAGSLWLLRVGQSPARPFGVLMDILIAALVTANTTHGAGTVYLHTDAPLFCSTPQRPLFYDTVAPPWVALPVTDFQNDVVRCGDLIYVRPANAPSFMARPVDPHPMHGYCVQQGTGPCLPIVVDVPEHVATWRGLSVRGGVEVINFSAVARECRARGMCD